MKKLLLITFLFSVLTSSAQTTTMIAVVLENGKEQEYLNYEKNWNKAAQQMVKDDLIVQWSVWKRTPRKGDDNWAQYYVFRRSSKEQDSREISTQTWDNSIKKAFKGKSKRTVDRLLSNQGIVKESRNRTYKWVAGTGWRGLEWEIGDKGYFHYMTKKNDDFIAYENAVWKPIAQKQILDGYRKAWGIAEITDSNDATKALNSSSTHIAFNFMTKKENMPEIEFAEDFLSKKAIEGMQNSREMMPAEELTLIYSTF